MPEHFACLVRRTGIAVGLVLALTACGDDGVSPVTGSVEVTTVSEGSGLDQDGYLVEVGGARSLAVGINTTATLAEVPVGEVEIRLAGVRGNCTVLGPNPRLVHVVAGETFPTRFDVACVQPPLAGRIVFYSDRDRNFELYTMQPDGSDQLRLTYTPDVAEYYPSISPDRTRILYSRRYDLESDVLLSEIWVVNAEGTGAVSLTKAAGFDDDPSWSPDGLRVAFTRFSDDGDSDVWVMSADGTAPLNLTNTETSSERAPVWSPDGTRILFTAWTGLGPTHLDIMNADGTGRRRLTEDPRPSGVGTWSPDGSRIAFMAAEGAGFRLYTMNVDGSDRSGLTPEGTVTDGLASWAPAGDRLVFESTAEGDTEVFVIEADGTGMKNITNNAFYDGLGPQAWVP
jgi:Tol biopolymer transport system component